MAEVTSVWLSPDRSFLVVQTDGEDGPLLGMDLSRTHPDGITPECHDADSVDASFTDLYGPGTALVANALADAVRKLTAIRLALTEYNTSYGLGLHVRKVLDS